MKNPSITLCVLLFAAACAPPTSSEVAFLDAGVTGRRIGIVNSDYHSVSVSLFDAATGALVRDDCVNSGTAQPAPALSLSGDVVLPSAPQVGGLLTLVDRSNATLTWVEPSTCVPSRQLSVGVSGAASFKSLPQDLLSISATKAYVIRMGKNPAASPQADDFDEGDDVLVIDPSIPAAKGRIDLSGEALPAATGETTQAMASRGVVVGHLAYIPITSFQAGYLKAGPGRVTIIDTDTDTIVGRLELADYKNCQQASTDPGQTVLVIGCGGVYADGAARVAESAFVAFDLSSAPPTPLGTWKPALFGGRAVALAQNAALVSASRGVTVVSGDYGASPTDGLWLFDAQSATKLVDSSASFEFGQVLTDVVGHQVYLTDAAAAAPRLRVFDLEPATPTERPAVDPSPSTGLPPRYLGWY
jgi:hypothetical protein